MFLIPQVERPGEEAYSVALGGLVDAALQVADGAGGESGALGQPLLRQSSGNPIPLEQFPERQQLRRDHAPRVLLPPGRARWPQAQGLRMVVGGQKFIIHGPRPPASKA